MRYVALRSKCAIKAFCNVFRYSNRHRGARLSEFDLPNNVKSVKFGLMSSAPSNQYL